jgi:pimeloyl-ACP methyl ester carboxylesterase
MKSKLLLSVLLLATLFQTKAQDVKQEMKPRPADYEYLSAPDSLGVRHQLLMPNLTNKNTQAIQNLPYPIIFIHGLNSNDLIWGTSTSTDLMHNFLQSQNLTFGGRFDFNLNYDGNNATANKIVWSNSTPNADIAQWVTNPIIGDYYFVNFDTGIDGSFHPLLISSANVLSNQSAIAKQAIALKRVIESVMLLTGRDKVILIGHSMGGLVSREYLQNTDDWVNTNHHVAKLVTTGTPHGGSNTSASVLGTIVAGIDNKSEAVRDLRTSYYYSPNAPGVFLFGGVESNYIMNDMLLANFYNVDVNCNGVIGQNIQGLNQRNIPNDLDYSCIIGTVTGSTSDGVVDNYSADLGNFYNTLPINKFYYTAPATIEIHTDLPKQIYQNMQGLDEPNEYNLAYGVDFGNTYKGFTTVQPAGGYSTDWDDYKFTAQGNGNLNLTIGNSSANSITVAIYNSGLQLQGQVYSIPNGNWSISIPLSAGAGQYYLEINGAPSTTSYLNPYTFSMTYTLSNPNFISENSLNLFPNPTTSKVFFDNTNYSFNAVSIYNYLGQEVATSRFTSIGANQEIDMSTLAKGVYILKFKGIQESQSVKIMKQ